MKGIYVHGTNGSGKTTLARTLIDLLAKRHGQPKRMKMDKWKCWVLVFKKPRIIFVGRYFEGVASGGMDTTQHYPTSLWSAVNYAKENDATVFIEGLVTPGLDTCAKMARTLRMHLFWLDVPVDECIRSTKHRRKVAGNKAPFNDKNLLAKESSARSWFHRLSDAGLPMERGGRKAVLKRCKGILNILDDRKAERLL